ncbi:hypothetical protein SFRURICE_013272 [Spodoptera frugiperda]|nr:hypothetical protein SFRURICE_013272 [Spodoptera frugiperda]
MCAVLGTELAGITNATDYPFTKPINHLEPSPLGQLPACIPSTERGQLGPAPVERRSLVRQELPTVIIRDLHVKQTTAKVL